MRFFGVPLPSLSNSGGRIKAQKSANVKDLLINFNAFCPRNPKGGFPTTIYFLSCSGCHVKKSCTCTLLSNFSISNARVFFGK